jgi:hypothetical protein
MKLPRLTGSRFECPFCRRHFAGPLSFDRHRADLQCLSIDGMRAAGLSLNRSEFWTIERTAPSDDPISTLTYALTRRPA